jgi:predicted nucleic acid-binding protein
MTVVVDTSALVSALLGSSAQAAELRRLLAVEVTHAPHLIDAELGNVLRRQVLRGEVQAAEALALLRAAEPLVDHRHATSGALASAAWALRYNLSFYDALYAALAGALRCTLLTADERLSRAAGLPCTVSVVAAR